MAQLPSFCLECFLFNASPLRRYQNSELTYSSVLGRWKCSAGWCAEKTQVYPPPPPPHPPANQPLQGISPIIFLPKPLIVSPHVSISQPSKAHTKLPATQPAPMKNTNLCFHYNFKNFLLGSHKTTCKFSLALSYS